MAKDIFNYNRFLKPLCDKLTNHKHRKLIGWSENFKVGDRLRDYDFYYKCKICGYVFFNHSPNEKELEFIKEYDKNS